MGFMGERDIKETTWDNELEKEAPEEYINSILHLLYPGARIKNRRKQKDRIDWTIYANIDDKTDLHLGETGNICLDEKTLYSTDKNLLQLFVNPNKLPGYHILIKNTLLNPKDVIKNSIKEEIRTTKTENDEFITKAYIIPIFCIKHAIISAYPSTEWWFKPHPSL